MPLVAKAELAQSYMHQARMMRRWGGGRSWREGWEFSGWVLFMDGDMIQEFRGSWGRGEVGAGYGRFEKEWVPAPDFTGAGSAGEQRQGGSTREERVRFFAALGMTCGRVLRSESLWA